MEAFFSHLRRPKVQDADILTTFSAFSPLVVTLTFIFALISGFLLYWKANTMKIDKWDGVWKIIAIFWDKSVYSWKSSTFGNIVQFPLFLLSFILFVFLCWKF